MASIGSGVRLFSDINNLCNYVRGGFVVHVPGDLCNCTHMPGLGSHGTVRLQP